MPTLAEQKCRATDHDLTSYPALWHFIIQFFFLLLTTLNQSKLFFSNYKTLLVKVENKSYTATEDCMVYVETVTNSTVLRNYNNQNRKYILPILSKYRQSGKPCGWFPCRFKKGRHYFGFWRWTEKLQVLCL